MQESTPLIHV